MIVKELLELYNLLDRPGEVGRSVQSLFDKAGCSMSVKNRSDKKGSTEFVSVTIPGQKKKAPTLGVLGRLGGIGARPEQIGFVSDGDGALTALAVGLRLARMRQNGDVLPGNVIVATQLDTDAPTEPHEPVPFMGSVFDDDVMNEQDLREEMDAIISIDTSRGNRIINSTGFAITPTVKEGWILKVSDDLLTVMEQVTQRVPFVVPITMQDITPYANHLYHFNGIMQPATDTKAPVVGLAITSQTMVPGCATGITSLSQLDAAGRYVVEVAKQFTRGKLSFYDQKEFNELVRRYGSMRRLQNVGAHQ